MMTSRVLGAVIFVFAAACGGGGLADAKSPGETTGSDSKSATKASAPAPAADDLGDLETKRMQENIKEKITKDKAKFKELCGYDVDVDVDWTSFGHNKAALEGLWSNLGVERMVDSFKGVCTDKTGKDAVKSKVKKLRAVNVADKSKVKATVSGGTFNAELDWQSGSSPALTAQDMATIITKAL